MKPTIENLQDTFKIGYETFIDSRKECDKVYNYFHNRQYNETQKATLANRGQPEETFNVIKLFTRNLLGYYSTIVNNVKAQARQQNDIYTASVLNDVIDNIFNANSFTSVLEKIELDGMLAGLMCAYIYVKPTGQKDQFNRPLYEVSISHIPVQEIIIDPMSREEDYSDAKWIHRFKWISKEDLVEQFGETKLKELNAYDNHLNVDEADFTYAFNGEFQGKYRKHDNYLVVHSIVKDGDKSYSVFWSADIILSKKEITYKKVKFPYRVQKVHSSNKAEYYGIFREIIATQDAINQALIKIQLMVNTQKVFVENSAVDNIDNFTTMFNRVNAVIPVKKLAGIRVENLTREVLDQYTIIDKALDRIQRILSINDSFLGMAYASDSGKKVQLQQNASVVALKYLTSKIENMCRLIGWDTMHLVQQYYTANQVLSVADEYEGQRWFEINRPLQLPTGRIGMNGQPETRMVYEEVLDPESGEPIEDENGFLIMAPIPEMDSEIAFTQADIIVDSVSYNDEEEQNNKILETYLNGLPGQFLLQYNPAGYAQSAALAIRNVKTKFSPELAQILTQTAQMMQQMQAQPQPQGGPSEQVPGSNR